MYKGFNRKASKISFFLKASARIVEPPRLEYKGFKYKYSLKGDIVRLWFVRSVYTTRNVDMSILSFNDNSAVIIRKKQDTKSRFINGPVSRNIKRRRLMSLFNTVL
jgi:ribosomal protein L14